MDYYNILQVPQNAAQDMIDSAYKAMCKKYHPDINRNPDAENRMKEINIAYEVLGDIQRRRIYNTQWLMRRSGASARPPFATKANPTYKRPSSQRPAPPKQPPRPSAPKASAASPKAAPKAAGADKGNDRSAEAKDTIQKYFHYLSSQLYKDAYGLVSEADRKSATQQDFTEWQKAVSNLYMLRSYQILTAVRNPQFALPDGQRLEAYKCMVQVVEEDRKTEKISRYTLHKYVLIENGQPRVHLGYKDIGHIAAKYRFKASAFEESAILEHWEEYKRGHDVATGLLNFEGFIEACEKEVYRYDRYKVDCCLMFMRLELPAPAPTGATLESQNSKGNMLDRLEMFIAESLKKHVRSVDIPGIYARQHFLCLLAHTNMRGAQRAIKRLQRLVVRDVMGTFEVTPRMRMICYPYRGGKLEEVVDKCIQAIAADEDLTME